jgi:glycosyltransferase involved in cell wall biosynthesis
MIRRGEPQLKLPLVSVVLPVYNGERFLAQALDSIRDQYYSEFEIIVVDDGSTDGSAEIARSLDRVRYMGQKHRGIACAWNSGIEYSRGEFVAFLAQDDLWTPNKLDVQVHQMMEHPRLQYTIARARCFLEPGCAIPSGFRRELLQDDRVAWVVETMLARKSLFESIGGFDASLSTAEDVDWFLRARDADTPMAVIPEVLLYRRIHDDNFSYRVVEENAQNLLRVMRQSILRRRDQSAESRQEGQ